MNPQTGARRAPLSMGPPRQEHWSGLPLPAPGESSRLRDWTCVSCTGRWVSLPLSHPGQPSLGLEVFSDQGWRQQGAPHLCIQLYDVGHLVPAKAHEAGIVAGTVTWHYHVGLVVSGPLHLVRGLSLPPAGVVCGRVALGPLVVPVWGQGRAGGQSEADGGRCGELQPWVGLGQGLSHLKV